jgi:acyl-CoA hydrolase
MISYSEQYAAKKIDVFDALTKIKSDSVVWTSFNAAEPTLFLNNLHTIGDRVINVQLRHAGVFRPYQFVMDPAMKGHILPASGFSDEYSRAMHDNHSTMFIPMHLHNGLPRSGVLDKIDVFVCAVAPMDQNGYFRMALDNVCEMDVAEVAKMIILEINPNFPRTHGDNIIHISDVDYLYESDIPLVTIPDMEPGELDMAIGKNVASLVPDGATIQLGIGSIPDAVAKFFREKNDLGVHTEMITTSVAMLAKEGVINGKKKTLHKGKIIGNFAVGSQELYDFMDDNPAVQIMRGSYTNNPWVIAQNDNMVSVNAALQVDLVGQICSESIGPVQYTGTGGAMDFAYGATHSKGGKSIIALRSMARKGTVSSIQPILTPGSIVSICRTDIDYVVTEYGIAELKGSGLEKRARELINISHPDFRDQLTEQAREYKLW